MSGAGFDGDRIAHDGCSFQVLNRLILADESAGFNQES